MGFYIEWVLWGLPVMSSRDLPYARLIGIWFSSCHLTSHRTPALNLNDVGQREEDKFQFLNDVIFSLVC